MTLQQMFKSTESIALYLSICSLVLCQLAASYAIDRSTGGQQSVSNKSQAPNIIKQSSAPSVINEHQPHRTPADLRRPIWVLDHMVNSIKELEYRLNKGANAIEADVTFGADGSPLYIYHGPPCDCWRHCNQQEEFSVYLNYVREISIDEPNGLGKNLTILFLDLKLDYLEPKSKAEAGIKLAESIVSNLFLDSDASQRALERQAALISERTNSTATVVIPPPKNRLRLILSINHVADLELVNNFIHYLEENNSSHLMERIGFDVGMNDDLKLIESMWRRFGSTINIWQGDGYTNCLSPFYNLERLSKAISKRDAVGGFPRKVYHWTIDLHDRMRESLKLGVDAIMTNHPERMLSVLREPEFAHDYRLATREDDPFKKITSRANMKSGESARYQRSTSPSNGGFLGSVVDVIYSWLNFVKEIPFLSLPTTSRFMPREKRHKSSPIIIAENKPQDRAASEGQSSTGQLEPPPPYEGPKWYTSLASNLLVSVMKIILPVQSE